MGVVGLAIVVVGIVIGFAGTTMAERATLGDSDTRAKLRAAQAKLRLTNLVIAAAVAVYLIAREYHHARAGLAACAAILVVTWLVAAAFKIRTARPLLSTDQLPRYRTFTIVEALGFIVMFGGVTLYLLRG